MSYMNSNNKTLKIYKKIIAIFTVLLFSFSLLFAVAKPSIDGHAVVADEGVMPKGLFAKTVGYLPGDSVSVTNPSTGMTISVLVLGSIDPSEGVAILLSPEAAAKLKIKKGSNILVKITKRVGELDESVSGSAVLNDVVASVAEETEKATEDVMPAEEIVEANEEVAPVAEETADSESEEAEKATEDVMPAEEIAEVNEEVTPVAEEKVESENEEAEKATEDIMPAEEIAEVNEELAPVAEEKVESESEEAEKATEVVMPAEEIAEANEELAPVAEETAESESEEAENSAEVVMPAEEIAEANEELAPVAEETVESESEEAENSAEEVIPAEEIAEANEELAPIAEETAESESEEAESNAEEVIPAEAKEEVVELDELEPVEHVKEELAKESIPESEETVTTEAEPEKVIEEELPVYADTTTEEREEVEIEDAAKIKDITKDDEKEVAEEENVVADDSKEEAVKDEIAEYTPIIIPVKPAEKEDVVIETDVVEDVPEVEVIADDITDASEEKTVEEPFRPIVLVPVESNPPEHQVGKDDKNKEKVTEKAEVKDDEIKIAEIPVIPPSKKATPTEEKKADEDIVIPYIPAAEENVNKGKAKKDTKKKEETKEITIPVIPEVKKIEPRPAAVEPKAESSNDFISSRLVDSLKNLKSGSYYVQIATLDDKENMKNIVDTYGKKYPIVFVPRSSGKSYQVLIGPLTVDEYGSVLQRFKARGYKDAFMRKIK